MSAAAKHAPAEIAVERGQVFRARAPGGFRTVVVEALDFEGPRATVREVLGAACEHEAMRALAGGACPVCAPAAPGGPAFTVALTVRPGPPRAWSLPAWYERVEVPA